MCCVSAKNFKDSPVDANYFLRVNGEFSHVLPAMRMHWVGHFKVTDTYEHWWHLLHTSPFVSLVLNYELSPAGFQCRINLSLMAVLSLPTVSITGNSHTVIINVIIVGQGRALQLAVCALETPDQLRTFFFFYQLYVSGNWIKTLKCSRYWNIWCLPHILFKIK